MTWEEAAAFRNMTRSKPKFIPMARGDFSSTYYEFEVRCSNESRADGARHHGRVFTPASWTTQFLISAFASTTKNRNRKAVQ